jgi:CRP/FNR family transcriptional regulator, cyclic AMP receptor protein
VTDALGYFASALVLLTFHASDMRALRLLAIASNAAFIAYAWSAGLAPVLALHLLLLPLNVLRLAQCGRPRATAFAVRRAPPLARFRVRP